ncbi:DUF3616 domain-containing protein [Luteolibacter marinus]|uniref:DUF3616 domain-containing protein n=1 Tax=Luteolibacter marinus TaxID=2776705 RepID=UPI0018678929|nr:DUF3616 domain-containing protein [Luteolibacter marinus]
MKRRLHPLPLFAVIAILLSSPAQSAWRMQVISDEWYFAGFEHSHDISGVAAATADKCLVGSDESFYVQPGVIDFAKHRIESRRPIPLPLRTDGDALEVDIEGIAYSPEDHAYYVAGSHGVGSKKGDIQPDRHGVYQVPVDPVSGEVAKDGIRRASLLPLLEKTPQLAPYLNQPLQQNGINIEGLACAKGVLFFGLRSPNKDGIAFVIELDAGDLFAGKAEKLTIHEIPVPKGRGIREIVAIHDGFVIVTGNASADASKKIPVTLAPGPDTTFELCYWAGGNAAPVEIGTLPQNGGKAEALLVLEDKEDHVDLLVVFDSLPGGLPVSVRLFR